jgi:hypothetical protein
MIARRIFVIFRVRKKDSPCARSKTWSPLRSASVASSGGVALFPETASDPTCNLRSKAPMTASRKAPIFRFCEVIASS